MSNWKKNLSEGQIKVMEEIIEQVPTTMGFRDVFVGTLDAIAGVSNGPKPDVFRFIVAGDGDVQGTNDETQARLAASDEDLYVIDVQGMNWLMKDPGDDSGISRM